MNRENVVYGLIYNEADQKILMVKNVGSSWTLPGGAVEKGETLEQAIIREVKEETNLTVEIEHLVAVNEAFIVHKGVHRYFLLSRLKLLVVKLQLMMKWKSLK